VDAFRKAREPVLIQSPVVSELDQRLRVLLASTVKALCGELTQETPDWCLGVRPLATPWFVSGVENLKASALVESPAHFRRRGIFVLANFLERR
jgi:hypothetical protein